MNKKLCVLTMLCTVILAPAKAGFWSYRYWYCPASWSEAENYFQIGWDIPDEGTYTLYVGGKGRLPDSNEENTVKIPFSDVEFDHLWIPPWKCRTGGTTSELKFDGYTGSSPVGMDIDYVTIEEGITHIGNWWFEGLFWLWDVSLPSTSKLESIGEGAFQSCHSLPEISIPDKVKSIGGRAFRKCGKLKYFRVPANCTLGDLVFENSGLETVDVNNEAIFGKYAFQNCKNLKSVTFSGRIREVTEGMFQGCKSLETLRIPDGLAVTSIGSHAFNGCSRLSSINIPNGVTSIGNGAFYDCSSLRTVNIPSGVTSIGDSAFNESGLTSVIIPNSVTKIGIRAFKYSSLTSITVSGSVKDIEHATFAYSYLISVKLCEGVKTVYTSAFQSCGNLEEVSLPASLDSVGRIAFGRCNNIKIIECNGTTPPALDPDAFLESDITETSLCVPYGSVEAYMNAPVWKDFKNIGTYPAGIHIINGEKFTVNSGSKIKLTAKLTPYNAVPAIVWTSSNTGIASVVDGTVIAHDPGEVIITATTVNGIFRDICRIQVLKGFRIPVFADSLLGEWLQCDENFQGIFDPETMKIRELIDISPEGNRTVSYVVRLYDFSQLRESYYCTVDEKNRSVYMQFLRSSVFFTAVELTDNTMTVTRDGSLWYYKRKG
jgi:hypothetical protein